MENIFDSNGYLNVETVDGDTESQTATDQYAIFLFKDGHASNSGSRIPTFTGQTTLACSDSPVVLQVYNYNSATWETLDSDSVSPASSNFSLTANVATNQTNYHTAVKPDAGCDDGLYWTAFRIYQNA
jgi:hypothetical protein